MHPIDLELTPKEKEAHGVGLLLESLNFSAILLAFKHQTSPKMGQAKIKYKT